MVNGRESSEPTARAANVNYRCRRGVGGSAWLSLRVFSRREPRYGMLASVMWVPRTAMSALSGLQANRLLVVAALVLVPVVMQSILRWYELHCRDRREARVVEMLERQQAALLSIAADLAGDQALAGSAVGLQALTSATQDLTQILVASPLVSKETATRTKVGSSREGRNDE
jgi:hypothetical protein